MFKNYLKVALRNLIKFKIYSVINIVGLAIGMAVSILILLYVQNELNYDRFNKNADRIYQIVLERKTRERTFPDISTPVPLGPSLINDFPQIVHYTRFLNTDNPIPLVSAGGNRFYEKQFFFADPDVFNIFTISFLKGDAKTALIKSNTVVITKEMAQKYFGEQEALGKTLTFNNIIDLEVTGIVENLPANSTIKFNFLTSFSTLYGWLGKDFLDNWQNNMCQTYIMLPENYSLEVLEVQLPNFIKKYVGNSGSIKEIKLQPLTRIHLYSNQDFRLTSGGDIQYIYLLTALAFFILFIACINYINLTTARFIHRSKEVGIRKIVGAARKQLALQFVGEGIFLTTIALLIAMLLVELIIPQFNLMIGNIRAMNLLQNRWLLLVPIGIVLLVGLLASIYPGLFLSSLHSNYSLKNATGTGVVSSRMILRKVLVLIQFILTIILIITTWVIYDQLNFMQNKRLGFDGDQVIVVPIREQYLRQNINPLKERLIQYPGIREVGAAALLPGGPVGKTRYRAEGSTEPGAMSMLWVDYSFIPALNIEIAAGRNFSKYFSNDSAQAFIINEEAVKQLNWKKPSDAIGKSFELIGSKKGTIIGVVKDFHITSLQRKIEPTVLHIWPWLNYVLVRVDAANLPDIIKKLKEVWNEFDPDNPFDFTFLNNNFDRFYQSEKQFSRISGFSTILAIFIACIGLFGLVSFSIEQKTREIGVRKVLGSSILGVVVLLIKGFIKLVLFANIIAWPTAYYFMNNWLQDFAYRINLNIWTFVISGLLAFIIALLTVSFQAIRAALKNPIDALKYE